MKQAKTYRPSVLNFQNLFLLIIFALLGYVIFVLETVIVLQVIYALFLFIIIDIQCFTKYLINRNTLQIKSGLAGLFGKQQIPLSKIQEVKTIHSSIKRGIFTEQLELIYYANDDYIILKSPKKRQEFINHLSPSINTNQELEKE